MVRKGSFLKGTLHRLTFIDTLVISMVVKIRHRAGIQGNEDHDEVVEPSAFKHPNRSDSKLIFVVDIAYECSFGPLNDSLVDEELPITQDQVIVALDVLKD